MDKNWLLVLQQAQVGKLLETNQVTQRFGLSLTESDVRLIAEAGKDTLKEARRVELGDGITPKIIFEFCDSAYLNQSNYRDTIIRLQEIFFLYKNEMQDEITDDELLHFMKEQFETVCYGDLDYLEGTCLANFARAIRAGYRGCSETDGYGEYASLDEVTRWDRKLYLEALHELLGE
ncbi:MAG: DUF6323 family protein [Lachnospiraceae bacterium]|jgi:hypothetical protein|nr:DUF6323 family protein [Lachnospiraceae bacterium]MCI1726962.1 DUF6323 family protein [Lachnospiraceae bacterium]